MKKTASIVKLFTLAFSLILAPSLKADPGTWMPQKKHISEIIIEGSTALILIAGGVPSTHIPSECNSPYNTILLDTEHGKGVLSVALAARVANMPVRLALSQTCHGTRPQISHIGM